MAIVDNYREDITPRFQGGRDSNMQSEHSQSAIRNNSSRHLNSKAVTSKLQNHRAIHRMPYHGTNSYSLPGEQPEAPIDVKMAVDWARSNGNSTIPRREADHPPSSLGTAILNDQAYFKGIMSQYEKEPTTSALLGNVIPDTFEGTSNMDSFVSKDRDNSSRTSSGLAEVKMEMNDDDTLNGVREIYSPPSSLSSQLSPPKSTTPPRPESVKLVTPPPNEKVGRTKEGLFWELRPRTSIPTGLSAEELARQSIHAAYSSRLNPFALHPNEYELLRGHIGARYVSAYLNLRNRILRLWVRNPLVSVTAEEAAGCSLSSRWLGLAEVAFEWLVRRGYINFGCVEVPDKSVLHSKRRKLKRAKRKTIVVVGAGMAGLGCARQLEGLFNHYGDRWASKGEELPRVIIVEGRGRIGGRVYSHPLKDQRSNSISNQSRNIAEMGAHIIVGFDHGNPLSMIIRGQLALRCHSLKDDPTLYDFNGEAVEDARDKLVEKLYNDILDRASIYRLRIQGPKTFDGEKDLIEAGRDPTGADSQILAETELLYDKDRQTQENNYDFTNAIEQVPGGVDKLTGKVHMVTGSRFKAPAAIAAEGMGWRLASNVSQQMDLNLDSTARIFNPTLGATMDEGVKQYQSLLNLSPQDMRLLNWHYANLEYANAANVSRLSLGGWDLDLENEFKGEHAQIVGGYQQVPRAVWHFPTKLDLRTRKIVKRITYDECNGEKQKTGIICEDGEIVEADHIVLTAPLGVLKDCSIDFEPKLPPWKLGPIDRMGFGLLNKIVLVYDEAFWDIEKDMFGLLRESESAGSLNQKDYAFNRGRFYLFWNCVKTSGRPVLIALMAGDAAHHAETVGDEELVTEVTQHLGKMYPQKIVPQPSETIITRWGKDKFARGSYSYFSATTQPGDFDTMAQPIGNLHFAGEATCGTHLATVHGAYLSGLRAASEIIDALLGPIEVPSQLIPPLIKAEASPKQSNQKRKAELLRPGPQIPHLVSSGNSSGIESPKDKATRLDAFEDEILKEIFTVLGPRPSKPGKSGANPFLLYSKDNWAICKQQCDTARRAATGIADSKASRNEVRAALGLMWREASDEIKKPYIEQTKENRAANTESAATFGARLKSWDEEAVRVRRTFIEAHPGMMSEVEEKEMWEALGVKIGERGRTVKVAK